ncbi:MAG: hypothetical protein COU11_01230 [Candidatus Harrisonbacteria bacterium CG10_big_fil_rev_8_21_14_0_10_49_15]|uniref:N-acetyltransferase domain-containing protein n=1 Tax=Candidatus Harrisonbacteria bacterium CG10_big_fil_rev_8_21_14_0_10_49_15 TaxID=1974587 RepID=A0A2H0ULI7_9BACT|nr:MAG: hypothetical protein COU11_01230 [Candidatus Harrisonbacteria bacterium CG10_big_fil_rev_8_21_14_0_10_49_15]
MVSISFKRATLSDIDEYLDIEKSVADLKTYSPITTEEEAENEIKTNVVYFIKNEDLIIGSIAYELKSSEHAYFSGLVVRPEFQGQGIAKQAMKDLLAGELKDMKKIDLVTHPHNTPAVMLYLSLGFIIEGWKDNYFGDGEPRIVLALNR